MKAFFRENLKAKLICFIFAFVLWVYVMSNDPIITNEYREIPVTISNGKDIQAEELVLAPDTVLVTKATLKGRRSQVSEIGKTGIRAYGIINDPKEGTNSLKLDLNLPNSDVDYFLSPSVLSVVLEKEVLEQKPVLIVREGELGKDFRVTEFQTNPSSIYVEGPKSLVDKVAVVRATIDISENTKDFSKKLQVVPVDREGNQIAGVKLNEDSVFVHGIIEQTKNLQVKLNLVGTEEGDRRLSGYTLTPSEVTVQGPSELLGEMTEILTEKIDVNRLLEAEDDLVLKLSLGDKLKSEIAEIKVSVSTEEKVTKEFEISKDKIIIRGGDRTLADYPNVAEVIKVRISYIENAENIIDMEDIRLYVEAKDIESNPANVAIKSEIEKTYETIEITPLNLDLTGQ